MTIKAIDKGEPVTANTPFMVAVCPVCKWVWQTESREDLRLRVHDEPTTSEHRLSGNPKGRAIERCKGGGMILDATAYGENGDPKFERKFGVPHNFEKMKPFTSAITGKTMMPSTPRS
jgi:hypothetical protein